MYQELSISVQQYMQGPLQFPSTIRPYYMVIHFPISTPTSSYKYWRGPTAAVNCCLRYLSIYTRSQHTTLQSSLMGCVYGCYPRYCTCSVTSVYLQQWCISLSLCNIPKVIEPVRCPIIYWLGTDDYVTFHLHLATIFNFKATCVVLASHALFLDWLNTYSSGC